MPHTHTRYRNPYLARRPAARAPKARLFREVVAITLSLVWVRYAVRVVGAGTGLWGAAAALAGSLATSLPVQLVAMPGPLFWIVVLSQVVSLLNSGLVNLITQALSESFPLLRQPRAIVVMCLALVSFTIVSVFLVAFPWQAGEAAADDSSTPQPSFTETPNEPAAPPTGEATATRPPTSTPTLVPTRMPRPTSAATATHDQVAASMTPGPPSASDTPPAPPGPPADGSRVTLCHNPGPNQVTITVDASAAPSHLAHDDYAGPCR